MARPKPDPKPCSIDGCDKTAYIRGWCSTHYHRWKKHGDPLTLKGLPNGTTMKWITETADNHSGDDCLIWPFAKNKNGRGAITVNGKVCQASRVVCEMVHGPAPSASHEAAHSCGNGHIGCVNPTHLRWATPAENQADKVIHGTTNRGERCGSNKLTPSEVLEIRKLAARKVPHKDIALQFGIAKSAVSAIHVRRIWFWLD